MSGKRVLITGGSRGIGAATAQLFAERGWRVCIVWRSRREAARELQADIQRAGGECLSLQADIAREADVRALFEELDARWGGLDVLVNNAGILLPQTRLENIDSERLTRLFATNVLGTFLCCREALLRMSTRHGGPGGAIVNVSSAAGRTGSPGEYIDYAATKGAMDTLTRGLAVEVAGEGVRVNAVRPGCILTEMHADGGEPDRVQRLAPSLPMGRGGRPEEVAEAIYWLASDQASFCTGTFIELSGGR